MVPAKRPGSIYDVDVVVNGNLVSVGVRSILYDVAPAEGFQFRVIDNDVEEGIAERPSKGSGHAHVLPLVTFALPTRLFEDDDAGGATMGFFTIYCRTTSPSASCSSGTIINKNEIIKKIIVDFSHIFIKL
jgi:hypothetical protein